VPTFDPECVDVGTEGLGDPQPVDREQRDQRVLIGRAEPGRDEQRANLIAVQADGVGLVVRTRPSDVDGG
jgi:hypothetical protein